MMANSKRYYPEIDGLRALAVIAVIINHIDKDWLKSGFLGVDVFFVISGFVVTKSLLSTGEVGLKTFLVDFYVKRVKRLVPALIFCICVSSFLALFLIPDPSTSFKTAIYALFGSANIYMMGKAVSYFSSETSLNLFTHTWSLAVEEQFYLLFPFIFYFSGRKENFRRLKLTLIMLTVVSFLFYLYSFSELENWSFYSLFSRFWQISIGGLLALFLRNNKYKLKNLGLVVSFETFFLVVLLCLSDTNVFVNRLLVSFLTIVAIFSISLNSKENSFLSFKPLVKVGVYSYSLYLWHWPVLSIFRNTIGLNQTSSIIAVFIFSFFSFFSYRFIENRMRKKIWRKKKSHEILLGMKFSICLGIILQLITSLSLNEKVSVTSKSAKKFYSLSSNSKKWNKKYCTLSRIKYEKVDLNKCYFSSYDAKKETIYIYGDSFAKQYLPAFTGDLEKKYNIFAVVIPGCPSWGLMHDSARNKSCSLAWDSFISFVKLQVSGGDKILFANTYEYILQNKITDREGRKLSKEQIVSTIISSLGELSSYMEKKNVYIGMLSGIPIFEGSLELCVEPWLKYRNNCYFNEKLSDETYLLFKNLKRAFSKETIYWIDTYQVFYQLEREQALSVYFNKNHISRKGSLILTDLIYYSVNQF